MLEPNGTFASENVFERPPPLAAVLDPRNSDGRSSPPGLNARPRSHQGSTLPELRSLASPKRKGGASASALEEVAALEVKLSNALGPLARGPGYAPLPMTPPSPDVRATGGAPRTRRRSKADLKAARQKQRGR